MLSDNYWYKAGDLENDEKKMGRSKETFRNDYGDGAAKINFYDYVVVSLFFESQKMRQLTLPAIPEGRYNFKGKEIIENSLTIQACKGKWFLYSMKPVYIYTEAEQYCTYIELKDQQLIDVRNGYEKCNIFVEYLSKETFSYHNYRILDKRITVGSSAVCDIVYRSKYIQEKEVEFLLENGQWTITKLNQQGTMLVNGKKSENVNLQVGDIVYIMGLKIIIGIGFFSINDSKKHIDIKPNKFVKISVEETSYFAVDSHKPEELELFNRRPRRRVSLSEQEIQIDAPPMPLNGDRIPLMLRMGGSMFHGATSMLSGNPTMMVSSVLFPILNSKYTEKQKKEYEERRVKKYREYLEKKRQEIEEERKEEERILNYNYPELQYVLNFTEDGNRLWERRKTDDDFLNIRLGNGNVPLCAQYRCAKERFSLEDDMLEDQMYELINTKVECQNAPIMNSFLDNYVCGILGTKTLKMSLIKRLIMQITLTHSYDEVKLIFLIDEGSLEEIDFIKYLPHVWDEYKTFRFIATKVSEAYQIGKYLKEKLEVESEDRNLRVTKLEDCLRKRPYYLVFALDKKLFDNVGLLKDILQSNDNIGVSIVTAFDDLPKECSKIFQLQSNGEHIITYLKELDKTDVYFQLDAYDYDLAKKSMGIVSNTKLKAENQNVSLPKMITFLEMFGVGKIEHLNSAMRWRESNPARTLTTPVGVGNDGTLFMIDLHQKYHGPHGLIAGMTGSGKSEFIITYILSMAVNYRPDEVAFLLIDYKGGGLTSAFEDPVRNIYLPHLMGTITNLDGAAINRSIISIESEITRRQKLFREAKSIVEDSTIDIYSYQKLYREGHVKEALPHLFIIADEFAEMKQQEPEFMDSLISIARIGRSLGVHLILATQKPSGVVNDQIRSNTKFRVCLKVQDKSDSMDMLKRPEGAEIKETGRFYLQVGYNELFALGQSAWTGADYQPQEEMVVKKDDSVIFLDTLGQSLHEEKPAVKRDSTGKSELSEIVKYLANVAKCEGIPRKQLWSEPLKKIIDSQGVIPENDENEFNVYLGEIDDPAHQKQYSYIYNFMECKNLLILGASKSGKTSMIQNILLQFTTRYTAEDIQYYILDYSTHLLNVFQKVPHCGAVLSEEDTTSVPKLFDLIDKLAEERRGLFKELEVDNIKDERIKRKIPLVFLVIDNLVGLRDTKEIESFYYNLNSIMKNVANYGIHFIITCTHLNEATARIRQEIGKCFAFGMKDKYEYQEALGCKVSYTPPAFPGRGLININDEPLEFQAAVFGAQYDPKQKVDKIKEILSRINESKVKALKIVSFMPNETYKDFSELFEKGRIPLGYSLLHSKPIALPLKQLKTLAVYMGNINGRIPIFENLLMRAQFEQMDVTIISRKKESVFKKESIRNIASEYLQNAHVVECEQEAIYEANKNILLELMEEKKHLKDYCIEHDIDMKEVDVHSKDFQKQSFSYISKRVKPRLIILESVKDICEIANDEVSAAINGLCLMAPIYNTYIIHCYEPGDGEYVKDYPIRKVLASEEMVLMFGGCYDKQGLINLEYSHASIQKPIPYNQALMKYRGNIYELIMPCRLLQEEVMEKDDESIF